MCKERPTPPPPTMHTTVHYRKPATQVARSLRDREGSKTVLVHRPSSTEGKARARWEMPPPPPPPWVMNTVVRNSATGGCSILGKMDTVLYSVQYSIL